MSALDDAREVLAWEDNETPMRAALAALVAECERLETDRIAGFLAGSDLPDERAQLGGLLVRAVEACRERHLVLGVYAHTNIVRTHDAHDDGDIEDGVYGEPNDTLPDALRALLAKVEGA